MKRLPSFFGVICCCLISLLSANAQQQKMQTSRRPRPSLSAPKTPESAAVSKPQPVTVLVRRLNTGRLALDGILFVTELDKGVQKKPGIAKNIRLVSGGPLKVEEEEKGHVEIPTMDLKREPVKWTKDPAAFDFLISWTVDWQERTKHQFDERLTIDAKETWKLEKVSDTTVTQGWTTSYVLTGEETGASNTSSLLAAEQTETLIAPVRGRILKEIRAFIAQSGNKSVTVESAQDLGDKLDAEGQTPHSKAASTKVDIRAEIELLSSNDPVRRGLAATRLRALGVQAAPAIPYLIGMLNDRREIQVLNESGLSTVRSSPREAAVLALKAIGQPAMNALVAALKASEGEVRYKAAWALGEIRYSSAVPSLIALLDGPDPGWDFREEAVEALGKIQDRRAVEPLSKLVKRGSYKQKNDAADALGRIKDPGAVDSLVEALREIPVAAARALGGIRDPRAVEPLVAILRNKDRKSVVGPENPYAYSGVTATPLETYYANAIEAAADALGEINDPRAVDPLVALLKETGRIYASHSLAACAARALGKLKDTRAIEPLVKALRAMELDYDRGPVAEALREITGERFPADPVQWEEWWKNKRIK